MKCIIFLFFFLKVVKVALDVHTDEASGDILVFLTGKGLYLSFHILAVEQLDNAF